MLRRVPEIYVFFCIAALALFALGSPMIAGEDADPLSGVFVFLVALPWILALDLFGELPITATIAAALLCMAINYFVLRWLTRRFHKSVSRGDMS